MKPKRNRQMTLKQKNTMIDTMVGWLKDKGHYIYFICGMFNEYFNAIHLSDNQIMKLFPELMTTINNVRTKQDKKDGNINIWQRNAIHYKVGFRRSNRIKLLLNVKRRINK